MHSWTKSSARVSSVRHGTGGGHVRRRRTHSYGLFFYIVLAASIASAFGFVGVLAAALAAGG